MGEKTFKGIMCRRESREIDKEMERNVEEGIRKKDKDKDNRKCKI